MNTQLTEIQVALLAVWSDFKAFCDKHNLIYYACGGTSIGTIRHKGFIPWDDDLDVYMTMEDYTKFLALKGELRGSDYEIIDIRDDNYYLPGFAKFSKVSSTIWEDKHYPFLMGVYIDVFPLYEIDNRENFLSLRASLDYYSDVYARSIQRYSMADIFNVIKRGKIRSIASLALNIFYHRWRKQKYRDELTKLQSQAAEKQGEYLVNYTQNPKADMFRKEWFAGVIEMPFEDQTMNMPIGYHDYLQTRFGDYMVPPPPEARISHHSRYFTDFTKRYTLEEIRQIKGE